MLMIQKLWLVIASVAGEATTGRSVMIGGELLWLLRESCPGVLGRRSRQLLAASKIERVATGVRGRRASRLAVGRDGEQGLGRGRGLGRARRRRRNRLQAKPGLVGQRQAEAERRVARPHLVGLVEQHAHVVHGQLEDVGLLELVWVFAASVAVDEAGRLEHGSGHGFLVHVFDGAGVDAEPAQVVLVVEHIELELVETLVHPGSAALLHGRLARAAAAHPTRLASLLGLLLELASLAGRGLRAREGLHFRLLSALLEMLEHG